MGRTAASLGSELVTGGDFSSATGWSLTGLGTSIESGTLITSGSGGATATTTAAATLTAGSYYVAFDVVATDGVNVIGVYVGGISGNAPGTTVPGSYHFRAVTTASDQLLRLTTTVTAVTIDNFSVKRIG